MKLVTSLADLQGTPIDYTRLKENTGLSTPTIKKLIDTLEAVFLIRRISIEGSTQGFVIYFEDLGEHRHLCSKKPALKNQIEHLCFAHLRTQFAYKIGEHAKIFQYRTRSGAYIPMAFTNQNGTVGVLSIQDISAVQSYSGSLKSFLAAYEDSKILILHPDPIKEYRALNSRTLIAPIGAVF